MLLHWNSAWAPVQVAQALKLNVQWCRTVKPWYFHCRGIYEMMWSLKQMPTRCTLLRRRITCLQNSQKRYVIRRSDKVELMTYKFEMEPLLKVSQNLFTIEQGLTAAQRIVRWFMILHSASALPKVQRWSHSTDSTDGRGDINKSRNHRRSSRCIGDRANNFEAKVSLFIASTRR